MKNYLCTQPHIQHHSQRIVKDGDGFRASHFFHLDINNEKLKKGEKDTKMTPSEAAGINGGLMMVVT